ncbi:hypothetical protein RDE2_28410 [Rhodococcus sp. RDE2]|nr:hypothetical protein RDE2_28410 [Rhodococcus sp. RDE2]
MRSVVIEWTEVSSHCAVVNVPADFDPEVVELGVNRLGFDAASFLEEDAHHVQALPRRAA